MKRMILFFVLTVMAAVFFATCSTPEKTTNTNTNTNANPAKSTGPSKDALVALETKAFEAWKNHDGKFFESFLTDNFVMYSEKGKRMNKAESIKEIVDPGCEIKSFSISEQQMIAAGADAAILTSKAVEDYKCGGKQRPANWAVATVFVRSGSEWKAAYHGEVPVIAPKDDKADAAKDEKADKGAKDEKSEKAPPPPPAKDEKSEKAPAKPDTDAKVTPMPADTKPVDPGTDAMVALEKKGWEAWKNRDAKTLGEIITKDFVLIDLMGKRYDNAGAIKTWTEPKCEIKSVSVTDPAGLSLAPDAGLLLYKGTAEGNCDGQKLGSLWGATVFVKDGAGWKAAMIFESPAS